MTDAWITIVDGKIMIEGRVVATINKDARQADKMALDRTIHDRPVKQIPHSNHLPEPSSARNING